jgi:hypothetical protein
MTVTRAPSPGNSLSDRQFGLWRLSSVLIFSVGLATDLIQILQPSRQSGESIVRLSFLLFFLF